MSSSLPRCLATAAAALVAAAGALGPAAGGAAAALTPNDPSFGLQWADSNTGQAVPMQDTSETLGAPASGTPGADDRAAAAWQVSTGSRSIVIGELDTGVEYTHPDLAANIWSNPGIPGLGCATGTHGYNVLTSTCDPRDEDAYFGGHGTHVAGILGAVGNNEIGVAGMNWQTTILPVKWLTNADEGQTDNLIAALRWIVKAKQAGVNVRVVNDSPGFVEGAPPPHELKEAIEALGANGILFVTGAGNSGWNDDAEASGRYICRYDLPNEICVTASNDDDELPKWANYGPHTVDLAAPGVSIYSTLREGRYGYLSGTSMAAPQVAGAAALLLSADPSLTPVELKQHILADVRRVPALSGKVISGGLLDVCKAMPGCEQTPSPPPAPSPAPTAPPVSAPAAPAPSPPACVTLESPMRLTVSRSWRIALKIAATGSASRCTVRVTIRTLHAFRTSRGRKAATLLLASGSVSPPAGKPITVRLVLMPRERGLLMRSHTLAARATLVLSGSDGSTQTVRQVVLLRLAPAPPPRHRGA